MRSRLIGALVAALLVSTVAHAQLGSPAFSFVAGTVISPDEVNSLFTTIYANALNRTGGTMTGTLTTTAVVPDGNDTRELGGAATRWSTVYGVDGDLSGTLAVTGAATLGSTLGVTGATTLAAVSATDGTFSGTLGVTGASTLAAVSATTGTFSGTLGVTGATTLAALSATTGTFSGDLTGGTYNGQTISNAASFTGTLGVAGATTLAGLSATTGSFSSTLAVTGSSSVAGLKGSGMLRSEGSTVPTGAANAGLDLFSDGTNGIIRAYNHSTSGYVPLFLDSSRTILRYENSTRLDIQQNGILTPVQPAFLAYNSTSDIGVASGSTVDFDTEVFDKGGNFSADVFVAPVAGTYHFCATVEWGDISGVDDFHLLLITTNRWYTLYSEGAATGGSSNGCVYADMATSDQAFIRVNTTDAGGADITGGGSPYKTFFSGRLAG